MKADGTARPFFFFRELQGISTGSSQEDVQSQNGSPKTVILGDIGAKSCSKCLEEDQRMPKAVRRRRRLERLQSTPKQLNQPEEKDRKEHWEPTSPIKKKTLDGCGDLHVIDADMLRSVLRRGSEGGTGRGKRTSWSVDRPGRGRREHHDIPFAARTRHNQR